MTEFFSECGDVLNVRIPTDRESGEIKGYDPVPGLPGYPSISCVKNSLVPLLSLLVEFE